MKNSRPLPRRSASLPANGLSTKAVTLKTPMAKPAPTAPAPSGPAANNGTVGIIAPIATKYANSARVSAKKLEVIRRPRRARDGVPTSTTVSARSSGGSVGPSGPPAPGSSAFLRAPTRHPRDWRRTHPAPGEPRRSRPCGGPPRSTHEGRRQGRRAMLSCRMSNRRVGSSVWTIRQTDLPCAPPNAAAIWRSCARGRRSGERRAMRSVLSADAVR
jgi:hypothetical protein